jgi:hypothetical protein
MLEIKTLINPSDLSSGRLVNFGNIRGSDMLEQVNSEIGL